MKSHTHTYTHTHTRSHARTHAHCAGAGPNGCGKSTLLRLVMGQEDPISGRVQLGPYNIVPAYFAQNQADALDLKQDVLQTMVKAAPDAQLNDVKALLGRMMFNGKAMEKKVNADTRCPVTCCAVLCCAVLCCGKKVCVVPSCQALCCFKLLCCA